MSRENKHSGIFLYSGHFVPVRAPLSLQTLVRCRHGPGALHPPHGEGVAQSLVRHIAAARHLRVQLVALQHLAQEVDVPGRQFQRLYFAQLVGGQRGDDFTQRRERLVQRLRPLALAHVGHDALRLELLEGLRAAAAAAARLLASLARGRAVRVLLPGVLPAHPLLLPPRGPLWLSVRLPLAVAWTVHRRDGGAARLFPQVFLRHRHQERPAKKRLCPSHEVREMLHLNVCRGLKAPKNP